MWDEPLSCRRATLTTKREGYYKVRQGQRSREALGAKITWCGGSTAAPGKAESPVGGRPWRSAVAEVRMMIVPVAALVSSAARDPS